MFGLTVLRGCPDPTGPTGANGTKGDIGPTCDIGSTGPTGFTTQIRKVSIYNFQE